MPLILGGDLANQHLSAGQMLAELLNIVYMNTTLLTNQQSSVQTTNPNVRRARQISQKESVETTTPHSQQPAVNTATTTSQNATVATGSSNTEQDGVRKLVEKYNPCTYWQFLKKGLLLVLDKKSKAYKQLNSCRGSLYDVGYYGHLELATVLLDAGLDVNNATVDGLTMLHGSAQSGSTILAQTILDHGADVDLPDDKGDTALMYASRGNNLNMVKLLVERGANVNWSNDSGYTSLHYAAENDRYEIVKYLVQAGANTAAKTKYNQRTPLDLTNSTKVTDMRRFLTQYPH